MRKNGWTLNDLPEILKLIENIVFQEASAGAKAKSLEISLDTEQSSDYFRIINADSEFEKKLIKSDSGKDCNV